MRLSFLRQCLAIFILIACFASFTASAQINPIGPVPMQKQKMWQEMELVFFAHFGVNTFTDREWGDGSEDPQIFNPTQFDAEQWARAVKAAGGKLIILTCKHHDGFCLWPSKYTEHSVKNSPWKNGQGDIVAEVAAACKKHGLKFGVYLSPWDRNNPDYGDSPVYNQYFLDQLTELLTNYGAIAEVWFDGANGEGPNGKRQVYDFQAYYSLIRKLQPQALIAIMGPDVRWVGNESGVAAETEWSVRVSTPKALNDPKVQFNETVVAGDVTYLKDAGKNRDDVAFNHLADSPDQGQAPLIWYPAETDVSIRPGWFYHEKEDEQVKSMDHLIDIYYQSIGRNTVLLLNIPPDRRGLFHENDVWRLMQFGAYVKETFATNLIQAPFSYPGTQHQGDQNPPQLFDGNNDTYWAPKDEYAFAPLEIGLNKPQTFDVILLQEPISMGQRIAEFTVEAKVNDEWKTVAEGTTIGYKRLFRIEETTSDAIRLTVKKSRGLPLISELGLYKQAKY
ncbi:MAG: alpha-L-fucosidase [Candidatus Hinthialibacter antarcticus]|nr:alpha-L-fucosidase [Candidatus Hinthialibacter antarcticus]